MWIGRRAAEVEVVHGADDAADRVQQGVEVDDPGGRLLRHHAQQDEDVGHHDGGEQLQEVLDPQVDDPETPEVGDGEVGVRPVDQAHGVEQRDRQRAVEEQVRQVAPALGGQLAAQAPVEDGAPQDHAAHQEGLPEPAQIEVLPALSTDERFGVVGQPALVAGRLAGHAADDDDDQRRQQQEGQSRWPRGSRPAISGSQEDAGGQVGGGHEEDGQLQVPGAGQVVGQPAGRGPGRRSRRSRVVVGRRPAQQRLHQEQGGDHEEVPRRGPLGRGQRHLRRRQEAQPALLLRVPAQQVGVAPEGRQHQPDPAQQRDDRQRTPDDGFLGQLVADQRFGRPVVRVRVGVGRGGGPRRSRPSRR